MIKLLKNAARIGMGTRARSLLVCTGIPVLLCVMYIFACVMLGKYGIIETNTYELTVMLESGALALAVKVIQREYTTEYIYINRFACLFFFWVRLKSCHRIMLYNLYEVSIIFILDFIEQSKQFRQV